jgi:hypothetical protein
MDPFALTPDGAAAEPAAFVAAVLADPAKRADVAADATLAPLFGLSAAAGHAKTCSPADLDRLQAVLRAAVASERARLAHAAALFGERSPECQRAAAPVPRATAAVYAQLRETGLEYGPAFRLLRNVHVPLPPPRNAGLAGAGAGAAPAPTELGKERGQQEEV